MTVLTAEQRDTLRIRQEEDVRIALDAIERVDQRSRQIDTMRDQMLNEASCQTARTHLTLILHRIEQDKREAPPLDHVPFWPENFGWPEGVPKPVNNRDLADEREESAS